MTSNAFDALALALPGVRAISPYQPGKASLNADARRQRGTAPITRLASNESPLGASPAVLEVLAQATDIARYPDNDGAHLKDVLSARHGLTAANITLGSGSSEVLELALRTFAGPAHEVLYSEHGFAMYPLVTLASGATGITTTDINYAQDLAATAARITPATRLVFIANPNNPTGAWFTAEALCTFLQRVPSTVLVVIDEAYAEYMESAPVPSHVARDNNDNASDNASDNTGDDGDADADTGAGDVTSVVAKEYPGYQSASAWLSEFPNLIVTRSFSKAFGLASLRIGYAMSDAKVAELMNRVRRPFNVNSLAQASAATALSDTAFLQKTRAQNRRSMFRFCRALEKLQLPYLTPAGNFITFTPGYPGQQVFAALQARGVIVRTLANYHMPRQLRVTMGTDDEMTHCITALSDTLQELAHGHVHGHDHDHSHD